MLIKLVRTTKTDKSTIGELTCEGELICYTLELPWRDNQSQISCIPTGRYNVTYLHRSGSGKYKDIYHIQNVKDRYGILIHTGNFPKDTLGCPLIGLQKSTDALYKSKAALGKLHEFAKRQSFTLEVL